MGNLDKSIITDGYNKSVADLSRIYGFEWIKASCHISADCVRHIFFHALSLGVSSLT